MSYDVQLAERIRRHLVGTPGVTERKMFGGLAFLVGGNMAVAANRSGGLMVRVDIARAADLLSTTEAHHVEMGDRQMRGWLAIDAEHVADEVDLSEWLELALAYVATLPAKGSG